MVFDHKDEQRGKNKEKRSLITKMIKGAKIKKIRGSSFSGLSFRDNREFCWI